MEKLSSTYAECLRKIFTWNVYRHVGPSATSRSELNLNKMLALSDKFGNPHLSIPCVHIAGTNGKGTTTIKTAAAFQKMNLKTGMFISPHISTFRERITIDSEMISE
jgi:dihydrofolate synthase/folylpolyglutamate synthase